MITYYVEPRYLQHIHYYCVPFLLNWCWFSNHAFLCRLSIELPEYFQLKQLPVWRGKGCQETPAHLSMSNHIWHFKRLVGRSYVCKADSTCSIWQEKRPNVVSNKTNNPESRIFNVRKWKPKISELLASKLPYKKAIKKRVPSLVKLKLVRCYLVSWAMNKIVFKGEASKPNWLHDKSLMKSQCYLWLLAVSVTLQLLMLIGWASAQ